LEPARGEERGDEDGDRVEPDLPAPRDGSPRAVRRADGDTERDRRVDVEAARVAGAEGEAERGPRALEERRGAVANGGDGEREACPARRRREAGVRARVEAGVERERDEHHVPGERP